jgi:hypothetical protein
MIFGAENLDYVQAVRCSLPCRPPPRCDLYSQCGPTVLTDRVGCPQVGILVASAYLLVLPTLHASQWGLRSYQAFRKWGKGKEGAAQRCGQCAVLSLAQLCLCWTLATLPYNGVNGSLVHFVIVAVVGCLWESLLSTYEVVSVNWNEGGVSKEGAMLQLFFFIIFIML